MAKKKEPVAKWLAIVDTEACDQYEIPFATKPTEKEIAREVWEREGQDEDLEFYEETIRVKLVDLSKLKV